MTALYDIQKDIESLLEQVDPDGVIPDEVCEALAIREEDKLVKVENTVKFIKNLEADEEIISNEIKKLQAKLKAVQRKSEWIKKYLSDNLHGEVIKNGTWSITYRTSESINDENCDLESLYEAGNALVIRKVSYQLDKAYAKRLYKNTGVLPEGVEFISKQNIQIR